MELSQLQPPTYNTLYRNSYSMCHVFLVVVNILYAIYLENEKPTECHITVFSYIFGINEHSNQGRQLPMLYLRYIT